MQEPPWKVTQLKGNLPPTPFPSSFTGKRKILEGIKVLELCRIIAGPTVTRVLAEYGADVLKITGPNLSDVPFFQVDGNMGKHAADLDLKSDEGRQRFEELLADVDVVVDGYRPGAIEKLGYGPDALAALAEKRGKGIVYVNENCFGYEGEWADRAGWQQIADCVCGILLFVTRFALCNISITRWASCTDIGMTGHRDRLGPGEIHGPQRARGPSLSHIRLWHRLHGCNRSVDGSVPPG